MAWVSVVGGTYHEICLSGVCIQEGRLEGAPVDYLPQEDVKEITRSELFQQDHSGCYVENIQREAITMIQ